MSEVKIKYSLKDQVNQALLEPGLPTGSIVDIVQKLANKKNDEEMKKRWDDIERCRTLAEIANEYETSKYHIKALIKRDLRTVSNWV